MTDGLEFPKFLIHLNEVLEDGTVCVVDILECDTLEDAESEIDAWIGPSGDNPDFTADLFAITTTHLYSYEAGEPESDGMCLEDDELEALLSEIEDLNEMGSVEMVDTDLECLDEARCCMHACRSVEWEVFQGEADELVAYVRGDKALKDLSFNGTEAAAEFAKVRRQKLSRARVREYAFRWFDNA